MQEGFRHGHREMAKEGQREAVVRVGVISSSWI